MSTLCGFASCTSAKSDGRTGTGGTTANNSSNDSCIGVSGTVGEEVCIPWSECSGLPKEEGSCEELGFTQSCPEHAGYFREGTDCNPPLIYCASSVSCEERSSGRAVTKGADGIWRYDDDGSRVPDGISIEQYGLPSRGVTGDAANGGRNPDPGSGTDAGIADGGVGGGTLEMYSPAELISVGLDGLAGNDHSADSAPIPEGLTVSDDGRYVAFYSHATNLTPPLPPDLSGFCYLRDRTAQTTLALIPYPTFATSGNCFVTSQGDRVIFPGYGYPATGLTYGIWEYSISTGAYREILSPEPDVAAYVSPNGDWLTVGGNERIHLIEASSGTATPIADFESASVVAVADNGNFAFVGMRTLAEISPDLWLYVRATGETLQITNESNRRTLEAFISTDGETVSWLHNDGNQSVSWQYELATGLTTPIEVSLSHQGEAWYATILKYVTPNKRFLAYYAHAQSSSESVNVVFDRQTGAIRQFGPSGASFNSGSLQYMSITPDGAHLAFASRVLDIHPLANEMYQAYVQEW
ncbi:MAG TPA: hypothetical protein VHO25_10225 [Polyangiaceae bacterium]|nr:hypothetical protein [Polyangiaceae bacterium]